MTTTFLITVNNRKIKTRILIDSGSARSYLCKSFVTANKIPYSSLSNTVNVRLPNEKNMAIRQVTKRLKLTFMNHTEMFEFFIANLQLQDISSILGRDWLNLHSPYIDYKNNKIYFLESHCFSHCPSAKGNKFVFHSSDITASLLPRTESKHKGETSLDSIIPDSISEDELSDMDICAVLIQDSKMKDSDKNEEIIKKSPAGAPVLFVKNMTALSDSALTTENLIQSLSEIAIQFLGYLI